MKLTRAAASRCLGSRVALLGMLSVGAGGCGAAAVKSDAGATGRDWGRFPAVFTMTGATRIDVLGDLHGDPVVTTQVLTAAGLVAADAPFTWTGGQDVLVVTGDVIDKGAQASAIIDLLIALEPQAEAAGGRVVVTLGNHEAEFMADPTKDKSGAFRSELVSLGLDPTAVAAGQTKYGEWLTTRPLAASIDGWFFSHAGNTQGASAGELAMQYQALFDDQGRPRFDTPVLIGEDSLLEAQSWWFGSGANGSVTNLDFDLAAVPARHLVFGHDPGAIAFPDDPAGDRAPGQMVARYGGRIFLIDVGMSYAVGDSSGSLLRIVRQPTETATEIFADGTARPLWP
jgi:hypothetical protein